jgi:hypothetical protein
MAHFVAKESLPYPNTIALLEPGQVSLRPEHTHLPVRGRQHQHSARAYRIRVRDPGRLVRRIGHRNKRRSDRARRIRSYPHGASCRVSTRSRGDYDALGWPLGRGGGVAPPITTLLSEIEVLVSETPESCGLSEVGLRSCGCLVLGLRFDKTSTRVSRKTSRGGST